MKINFSAIQTGDTFFTRSFTPIGLLIQAVTGWGKPTHVGKIIKNEGRLYVVEMIGDFNPNDNDLIMRPIDHYLSKWRFWTSIISIKRTKEYEDEKIRDASKKFMIRMQQKINPYDWQEIFAFLKRDKTDKSPNLICSRFVYQIDKLCGVNFGKYKEKFDKLVSPVDLFECPIYNEIPWRRSHATSSKFIHSL